MHISAKVAHSAADSPTSPWIRTAPSGQIPPGTVVFTVKDDGYNTNSGIYGDLGGLFGNVDSNAPEAVRKAAIRRMISVLGVVPHAVHASDELATVAIGGTITIDASALPGQSPAVGDVLVADIPEFGADGQAMPDNVSLIRRAEIQAFTRLQPRVASELNPVTDMVAAARAHLDDPKLFERLMGDATPEADAWSSAVTSLSKSQNISGILGMTAALMAWGWLEPTDHFIAIMQGAHRSGPTSEHCKFVQDVKQTNMATHSQQKRMADIVACNIASALRLTDSRVYHNCDANAKVESKNILSMAVQRSFFSPDVENGKVNVAHEVGFSVGSGAMATTEHLGRGSDGTITDDIYGSALAEQQTHLTKGFAAVVDAVHADDGRVIGRVAQKQGAKLVVALGRR